MAGEVAFAEAGDTRTLPDTLEAAETNLGGVGKAPTVDVPCECIADKGYFSRAVLKELYGGVWKTRSAEPKHRDLLTGAGTPREASAARDGLYLIVLQADGILVLALTAVCGGETGVMLLATTPDPA